MAHYAKVKDGIVQQVIVAEADFFDTYVDSSPGEWIQTSYNTIGGKHLKGGTPLRKNFACVGDVYDRTKDAFYKPQPYPSWKLNEDTCIWECPVEHPVVEEPTDESDTVIYVWDEENKQWVKSD